MCCFKGPFRGTSKTQLARKINEGGLSFFLCPPASCGREQRVLLRPPTPELWLLPSDLARAPRLPAESQDTAPAPLALLRGLCRGSSGEGKATFEDVTCQTPAGTCLVLLASLGGSTWGCAGGRLCLLLILGFCGRTASLRLCPCPQPHLLLADPRVQGGRPQFLLSDPLCSRVSDLDGLNLQIILHSPRNNFPSQLQPWGWFSPRALCLFFWASFSVISLVTCDTTLP